jgi:hypothetical protein
VELLLAAVAHDLFGDLATHTGDLALERAHAGFARVELDDRPRRSRVQTSPRGVAPVTLAGLCRISGGRYGIEEPTTCRVLDADAGIIGEVATWNRSIGIIVGSDGGVGTCVIFRAYNRSDSKERQTHSAIISSGAIIAERTS